MKICFSNNTEQYLHTGVELEGIQPHLMKDRI
jgi:hypothetical protein